MTALPSGASSHQARWGQLNHSILFTDMASFNEPIRDEADRRTARTALYSVLRTSLTDSGIPWEICRHEDRRDGVLTVVPPSVATVSIVSHLITHIDSNLKQHNREAAPVRVQLRAALHVGAITISSQGLLSGYSITTASHLLNAPALTRQLARTDVDLAVMVSSQVYETVIRHASGFADPTRYQEITVLPDEPNTHAWMYLKGTGNSVAPILARYRYG